MLQPATIQFLKTLKKNNNKEWFDANRKKYEIAKTDFCNFIDEVILEFSKKDKSIKHLKSKECIFRINRDIRFSKDKTPYKTNFGASINKAGRKAWNTAGYYFHLEPGSNFVGGGIYMPPADVLSKLRQEIDYNFKKFKTIINAKKFVDQYKTIDLSKEYSLTRVPKGYEPDNPAADYLKLKSIIAGRNFTDKELMSKDLVKNVAAAFEALFPLIEFINEGVA